MHVEQLHMRKVYPAHFHARHRQHESLDPRHCQALEELGLGDIRGSHFLVPHEPFNGPHKRLDVEKFRLPFHRL